MPSDQAFSIRRSVPGGRSVRGMAQREPLTADQRNSFVAALLGWMMDAFDYFLVVLVYAEIAKDFLGLSWRWLFALSIIPALISLLIRTRVKESAVWQDTREKMKVSRSSFRDVLFNPAVLRRFGYLILLMTAFNWMSHGTQDIYPTFLKATDDGGAGLSTAAATWIAVIYNVGATIGGVVFGTLSSGSGGGARSSSRRCWRCRSCPSSPCRPRRAGSRSGRSSCRCACRGRGA